MRPEQGRQEAQAQLCPDLSQSTLHRVQQAMYNSTRYACKRHRFKFITTQLPPAMPETTPNTKLPPKKKPLSTAGFRP